jgi:hypothetical protein
MRKKLIAVALSISMALGGISTTETYAYLDKMTKTNILQNKGDTYTLENYVSSPEEAQKLEEYYFLNNISEPYKITIDAKSYDGWLEYDEESEKMVSFYSDLFKNKIDGGIGKYCHKGGVNDFFKDPELLTDGNGKKYIVLNLKNYDAEGFLKQLSELQEVRDRFLATMPKLDEMSDYEKVLGILSFMSYIKYGKTDDGRTIDDAYTALVEGKATCTGYADAFNFLAKTIKLDSVEIYKSGVHSWNAAKVCGKWYELEPQSKNNPSSVDAVKNINMTTVLRGTDTMLTMGAIYSKADLGNKMHPIDARTNLPISNIDYMDYKEHSYTNHTIKWNGSKATFYRTCSKCGEYENDGFEYDEKNKFYHMVDRKYIGTDCDVTKVSEKKCGDATVTKYEASVTVDGKNYTSEHTVVDGEASHTVKDSDIKVIKEATCTEEGTVEKTCETCGYTWTENIPKTEHHYVTTTTKLDTCEEKSEYTVEKCSECGDVKSTSKKLYYSAHDFQFTSHKKEPTCTEKGEDLYTCTICNGTETREVPMVAHETELRNYKAATCTEDGYTGDETCINCGKVISKGKKTYATGHSYVDTLETVYETDMSMGLTYKYAYVIDRVTCKKCDFEMIDGQTESKLVGWILADGTEVSKEDGYEYEYVTDKNGNLVPKKIDHSVTQPTSRPSISPTIYETGDYTDVEDTTKSVSKVPAKVKISSAKNLKGKKIAIKWKKVKKATKYQVKAVLGNKVITKKTTKTSCTIKKLKRKKTYKIYVRAYNKAGYGKWSKVKKVYIKK